MTGRLIVGFAFVVGRGRRIETPDPVADEEVAAGPLRARTEVDVVDEAEAPPNGWVVVAAFGPVRRGGGGGARRP